MTICAPAPSQASRELDDEIVTTAGVIAIGNLDAQIDGQAWQASAGRPTVNARAALIDLVTLRGHVLGRIADYERASAMADQLAEEAPSDGDALLARARTQATFHRFTDALTDLDQAERLGADRVPVDAERAAVFQAVGRYDEALAIYREAVQRRPDFTSLGDLAVLHAERGEIAEAEGYFSASRERFRGISPIPLAQLDFKRAHLWITLGDLPRARTWLEESVRRLPAYSPAAGHLAEVEAALGDTDLAIERLVPLALASDDPDYAAQLARILDDVGRSAEAEPWRNQAADRYDELCATHLEAFADHAADFWLEGGSPQRALWLAQRNLDIRPTPRARELVARAKRAADEVSHLRHRQHGGNDMRHEPAIAAIDHPGAGEAPHTRPWRRCSSSPRTSQRTDQEM